MRRHLARASRSSLRLDLSGGAGTGTYPKPFESKLIVSCGRVLDERLTT